MDDRCKYNWTEIQAFYDNDHSIRECQKEFGFSSSAWQKAKKSGKFLTRSHKESMDLVRGDVLRFESNGRSETSQKGDIAVAKVDLMVAELNGIISRPSAECLYDRIIDIDGILYKAQVKYTSHESNGSFCVSTNRTSRERGYDIPYSRSDIDVIIAYHQQSDKLYWLPPELWEGKMAVSLRWREVNRMKFSNWAEDYEWKLPEKENIDKEERLKSNYKEKTQKCKECDKLICENTKTGLCHDCYSISERKVVRPDRDTLIKEVENSSYVAVGKKYGVSDNAIRKWIRS